VSVDSFGCYLLVFDVKEAVIRAKESCNLLQREKAQHEWEKRRESFAEKR